MSEVEARLAKLIVLRRVREEREREALAAAVRAEEEARSREEAGEACSRAADEERARAVRDRAAPAPAQVLQFRSRYARRLDEMAVRLEVALAAMQGERITAAEAAARVRAGLEQARRARDQLQQRLAEARRERRRRREKAEEGARDDQPGPPPGGGGSRD